MPFFSPPEMVWDRGENGQKDILHHLHLWYPEFSPSLVEKPKAREVETCLRTKSIYNAIL